MAIWPEGTIAFGYARKMAGLAGCPEDGAEAKELHIWLNEIRADLVYAVDYIEPYVDGIDKTPLRRFKRQRAEIIKAGGTPDPRQEKIIQVWGRDRGRKPNEKANRAAGLLAAKYEVLSGQPFKWSLPTSGPSAGRWKSANRGVQFVREGLLAMFPDLENPQVKMALRHAKEHKGDQHLFDSGDLR